jgi:hypothetical protein
MRYTVSAVHTAFSNSFWLHAGLLHIQTKMKFGRHLLFRFDVVFLVKVLSFQNALCRCEMFYQVLSVV